MTIRALFQLLKKWKQRTSGITNFEIKISYLEIYNECVNDLLNEENKNLEVQNGPRQEAIVRNLTELKVANEDMILDSLEYGERIRKVAGTAFNSISSRSHTVFKISLTLSHITDSKSKIVKTSEINLVDLAGSEGITSTNNITRVREASNINKSLLALSNVIQQLGCK